MKHIIFITILVAILFSSFTVVQAEEIDFDEIAITLHQIQRSIQELQRIVQCASEGKVTVKYIGDINFTTAQMNILKAEYNSLKAQITALWQTLP